MGAEPGPRREFVESLRAQFVADMRSVADTHSSVDDESAASDVSLSSDGDEPRHDEGTSDRSGRRARWLWFANVAAIGVLVGGLVWLARPGADVTPQSDPSTSAAVLLDPVDTVAEVCAELRADAELLPLGPTPAEVERAASDATARLTAAAERLDADPGANDLNEVRRHVAEALDAARRLAAVSDGDREEIDRAVDNLDLLVTSLERELSRLAAGECDGLTTIREVL